MLDCETENKRRRDRIRSEYLQDVKEEFKRMEINIWW